MWKLKQFLIVSVLSLVLLPDQLAQMSIITTQPPRTTPIGSPITDRPLRAHYAGQVRFDQQGAPAMVLEIEGLILRTRDGRTRQDVRMVGSRGDEREQAAYSIVMLRDFRYVIDHAAKIVIKDPRPNVNRQSNVNRGWVFPSEVVSRASGEIQVLGRICNLVSFGTGAQNELTGEAVISEDLQLVVREEASGPGESYVWEVTQIEEVEPDDPQVFEAPKGYREVETKWDGGL